MQSDILRTTRLVLTILVILGGMVSAYIELRVPKIVQKEISRLTPTLRGAAKLEGAVVAFDRPEECPEGWDLFKAGFGRMIIGAGGPGDGLTKREFRLMGGTESHRLTSDELPRHEHPVVGVGDMRITEWGHSVNNNDFPARLDVDDGPPYNGVKGRLVAQAKKTEAVQHNNMPPFISLYLCKKTVGNDKG